MISPAIAALAAPLAEAVASVSIGAVRSVDQAFERLLHLGEEASSPDEANEAHNDDSLAETDPVSALEKRLDTLASQLRERATATLADAGISLDGSIVLENDPLDGARVVGDHPQARRIESLLNGDPQFAAALEELAGVHRELASRKQQVAREHLYELDPDAARRDFEAASLLDESAFRITLAGQTANVRDE